MAAGSRWRSVCRCLCCSPPGSAVAGCSMNDCSRIRFRSKPSCRPGDGRTAAGRRHRRFPDCAPARRAPGHAPQPEPQQGVARTGGAAAGGHGRRATCPRGRVRAGRSSPGWVLSGVRPLRLQGRPGCAARPGSVRRAGNALRNDGHLVLPRSRDGRSPASCRASAHGALAQVLFNWMFRNSDTATAFFKIPPNRVVELGSQVEL
jgi:hypothetical protein